MTSVYVENEVKATRDCCPLKGCGCIVAHARIQRGRGTGVPDPPPEN